MKKLAIIGASYLQLPLVQKAKEMGLFTICFAWEDGSVCKNIADVFYPVSIVEKEKILTICRQERIDGICTIASDVAAPTVAYIAEAMRLTANSYESAVRANNKFLMRKAFIDAEVPCPRFNMVKTTHEISKIHLDYPIIVKPSDRSGSLGVTKVNSTLDLIPAVNRALEVSFKKEAMIEEYIEGQEISVEFISHNGIHYPLQITDKVTTGAPYFVELEHHQPSSLPSDMYARIYNITKKALNALGITEGASHSEYKITKNGRIAIMEIGARMGGDFIGSDLVYLSTGYDYLKGVIAVSLNQFSEPKFLWQKHSGVYFFCKESAFLKPIFENLSQHSEIIRAEITDCNLKSVMCSADRSGYFIYNDTSKKNYV